MSYAGLVIVGDNINILAPEIFVQLVRPLVGALWIAGCCQTKPGQLVRVLFALDDNHVVGLHQLGQPIGYLRQPLDRVNPFARFIRIRPALSEVLGHKPAHLHMDTPCLIEVVIFLHTHTRHLYFRRELTLRDNGTALGTFVIVKLVGVELD